VYKIFLFYKVKIVSKFESYPAFVFQLWILVTLMFDLNLT